MLFAFIRHQLRKINCVLLDKPPPPTNLAPLYTHTQMQYYMLHQIELYISFWLFMTPFGFISINRQCTDIKSVKSPSGQVHFCVIVGIIFPLKAHYFYVLRAWTVTLIARTSYDFRYYRWTSYAQVSIWRFVAWSTALSIRTCCCDRDVCHYCYLTVSLCCFVKQILFTIKIILGYIAIFLNNFKYPVGKKSKREQ